MELSFPSGTAFPVTAIIVSLTTCTQPVRPDDGGTGIIVPGKSVEGMKLGDLK